MPSTTTQTITLRRALPGDASAIANILFGAFGDVNSRHGFPSDFPEVAVAMGFTDLAFNVPFVSGWAAMEGDRIVGSSFVWDLGAVHGIGPISVDPASQGGVGRTLMEAMLEHTRAKQPMGVRLVQAGFNMRSLSLYAKLGFEVRESLVTFQGRPTGEVFPGTSVRAATAGDAEAANALCHRVHGHSRAVELMGAIAQGTASVAHREGRLVGYTTGIGYFGHAVAEDNDALKAMIAAAAEYSGAGFNVPTSNADLFRWCLDSGLRAVQPLNLMTLGEYQRPQGAFLSSILF